MKLTLYYLASALGFQRFKTLSVVGRPRIHALEPLYDNPNDLFGQNKTQPPGSGGPNEDFISKFANFMGFEEKEKWDAVRYSFYALVIGYLSSALFSQIAEDFSNPFKDL